MVVGESTFDASWLNQGGEGETDFHDKLTMKDGKSSQSQVTYMQIIHDDN